MRWLLPLLLASVATLAVSISSVGRTDTVDPPPAVEHAHRLPFEAVAPARPVPSPPRVACKRPRTLLLRRFEDRSARLECAGRTLVRVAVPG